MEIDHLSPEFNGRFIASLKNGENIITSRGYVPELKKKLGRSVFDWFELTLNGCIMVALSVAGVYLIATVISIILSKGEADEMTKALKHFNNED